MLVKKFVEKFTNLQDYIFIYLCIYIQERKLKDRGHDKLKW